MKTTHTPGPWKVSPETTKGEFVTDQIIRGPQRHHVATVTHANESNAALIAAAPDLLEALERLTRWVGKGIADGAFDNCVLPNAAVSDLDFAESVINKTKGVTQ